MLELRRRRVSAILGGLCALAFAFAPLSLRAEPVRTVRVVTAKGQPYYISSYFLNKVAPPDLKFELVDAPTSSEALDSLLTGNSDVAYMGLITSILAVSRGRPISIVAAVGYKGTRILARADSNIRTIADLAGKNIGVSKSSTQDIIMRELLAQAGIDPAKGVNWILLPTNAHFEAMASKTVDAVTTSEPYGTVLVQSGIARSLVDDPYKDAAVSGVATDLVFSREMIAKDPAFVQRIVDLHAKATVYVNEHPDEVVQALVASSRQTEPVMRMALQNAGLNYDIGPKYINQTKILMDELVKAKYLDKPLDTDQLFNLQFLPKARVAAGVIY
ncbi:ABC transporter substrate-binding protein [Roseixanthobacter liquoris]|uniref:ABC transporter substrate-binding protein n=1 Tax=Roseixanthobacter liquoris TaxID=3119921 RepID=UPI00372AD9AE